MQLNKPKPLEEVDPELAELIKEHCNRRRLITLNVGRNDPCPCGLIKNGRPVKFKKCCGK